MAKEHRAQVCSWLAKKDESLEKIAKDHIPGHEKAAAAPKKKSNSSSSGGASKKRKSSSNGKQAPAAKRQNTGTENKSPEIIRREAHAMTQLREFVKERGASESLVDGYRSRVTRKPSDGRYDTNFFNPDGRRFRSMLEVGRFLGLVSENEPKRSAASQKMKKKTKTISREAETAKRKLRIELDKLRRQHTKATKDLDDFVTNDKESRYPVEDLILQEEQPGDSAKLSRSNCAAARIPDVEGFAGIPSHCVPDVLMAWDFLCTFSRVLSLAPIGLDDFVYALTYMPPKQLAEGDQFSFPPVYVGEAHLALLKLLLADPSSDDWWWSILDEDEDEKTNAVVDIQEVASKEETDVPLIKIDFGSLLASPEEALITQSWVQSLEAVRTLKVADKEAIKSSIRSSMNLVANKYVKAYLRKALKLGKTSGVGYMKRAVVWLVDRVREARPELFDRGVSRTEIGKRRAKVVEDVALQMEKLGGAALKVDDDDLVSDAEDSDDESDDEESDDEDAMKEEPKAPEVTPPQESPDARPASHIPPRPLPTLVDLMLPPEKPLYNSDLLNPCTWTLITGAAAERIIHRYKRVRNEMDDKLREFQDLPKLTVAQRRQREALATSRVFSECFVPDGTDDPAQTAADLLCSGGDYLDLTIVQRICILRILIEAAYDTSRVFEVVDSNYKQRTNAIKALGVEQRKAKKEAKEKAIADETLAREDLAYEAKNNFLEEKREEIRKANEASQELTEQEIQDLTEDDITDFDDDIKADFESLPGPESFKKAEVMERVNILQETAAFSTDLLTVMNLDEIVEKESLAIKAMESELSELGGEQALMNTSLPRETQRKIEKLGRDIMKAREVAASLPIVREAAVEELKDAMADGTIKSLRHAIRTAKNAKLFGPDEETNGVWTLDIVRDAHMELENAKQLKKVADAQKDLVSKLNKCFIRTEPLGEDRFRNRFWQFEAGEKGHIWAEVDYVVQNEASEDAPRSGFLDLTSSIDLIKIGAEDMEEDLAPMEEGEDRDQFKTYGRKEHHPSGMISSLVKRHWGCHVNESSLRSVMKGLDGRGVREDKLKKNLKEALEDKTISADTKEVAPAGGTEEAAEEAEAAAEAELRKAGDEAHFLEAKEAVRASPTESVDLSRVESLSSGIGARVRVRFLVDKTKEGEIVRYEVGSITGWKLSPKKVESNDDQDVDTSPKEPSTPVWKAWTDRGNEAWLSGAELLESMTRFDLWSKKDATYFESDAAFLAYRNAMGRHLGKAADAAQGATPFRLAQYMVRIEGDIYAKLKHAFYDNTWGGKNGSRNAWMASMKDYAFDFQTVRDGLMTLEKAFFDITGGFPGGETSTRSGRELLDDPNARPDIELESMPEAGKSLGSIWSSLESRAVFLEIIQCKFIAGSFE